MPTVNGYSVVDRNNRPSVNSAVLLRAFFVNDGEYQDPVDISGVTVFSASSNYTPSTLFTSGGLIDVSIASSLVLMHFGVSSHVGKANTVALDASDYNPGNTASGVYKLGTGQYGVILNGTVDLSGYFDQGGAAFAVANAASAALEYLDVWTVKLTAGSDYKTIVNNFKLNSDTFFTLIEPLIFETRTKLSNKRVQLGSKIDLKIFTEVYVQNKGLDEAVRNIFKESVITNPAVQITKLNNADTLSSRFTVSGFSDTSSTTDVTRENTIIFNWDTRNLLPIFAADNTMGGVLGIYEIKVQYSIMNNLITSPPMYVSVL